MMRRPYSWLVLVYGVSLLYLSTEARAQEPGNEALVCREDAPPDEACGDPSTAAEEGTSAGSTALPPADPEETAPPPPFEPPAFLFGVNLGPFFSFGGLVGGGVDLDFQFKIHRNSYLGIVGGYLGGYQIVEERQDSLISGLLAYRHYFPFADRKVFSIMAGPAIGYYFTGPENGHEGYDWISAGLKAAGYYHLFLSERTSIGVGIGFGLYNQFAEFHERAKSFLIFSPELRLSLTF